MKRDNGAPCMSRQTTGMAYSILAEIGQMLTALSERGETGGIDLRSLPMTDVDREQLQDMLGHGEVSVEMDLAGASELWETSYPGVWWIRHKGAGDKISTEEIAITPVPEILMSHQADIAEAAARIQQALDSTGLQSHEHEPEARNV